MPTKRTDPDYRRGEKRVSYLRRKRLSEVRRLMVAGEPPRAIVATIARKYGIAESTVRDKDMPEANAELRAEDALISDASIARVVLEERLLESRRELSAVVKGKRNGGVTRVSAIRARVDVDMRLAELQGVTPRTGDGSDGAGFVLHLDLEPDPDEGSDSAP